MLDSDGSNVGGCYFYQWLQSGRLHSALTSCPGGRRRSLQALISSNASDFGCDFERHFVTTVVGIGVYFSMSFAACLHSYC